MRDDAGTRAGRRAWYTLEVPAVVLSGDRQAHSLEFLEYA